MEKVFEEWDVYSKKKMLKKRDVDLADLKSFSENKIVTITGIRRCGKSSLLMLLRQHIEKKGQKTAYVNLEDSRLKNNPDILDEVIKWFGDEGYLILDEVTNVVDWDGWLARNHEMLQGRLRLIVSSSRQGLGVSPKPLRGRIIPNPLYPLSLKELLQFLGITYEQTTVGHGKMERLLESYLVYGGFPEVVLADEPLDKIKLLNTYFEDIVALDVSEVSKTEVSAVKLFGRYVIESTYFSASKALNFFKSAGFRVGKQTLLDLEGYCQGSYLFFFVPIQSFNIKDRSQYPRKCYMGDTGLLNAISGKKDMGRLYENAVFLELKRRAPLNRTISYWKDAKGKEADFLIMDSLKARQIIQVTYDLRDVKTVEREVSGLVGCAKEFGLSQGLIINKDVEKVESVDGIKIRYVPLWKWLLELE